MIYLSKPNGSHAVFWAQQTDPNYSGPFDIILLRPGTDYSKGYPNEDFVGNRMTLEAACKWADACEASVKK